jgi:hypothetical protein
MENRPPSQPQPEAFTGADRAAYDRAARRYYPEGELPDLPDMGAYFGALINSPRLCEIAGSLGTFVRTVGENPGSYSHAEREFVDQVLAADWKTNIVAGRHIPDALSTGVRIEAIEALRFGHEEDLTEDEQLLARFIRAVVVGNVGDELYAAAVARFGLRGAIDYAGFVLWLQWIIRMMLFLGLKEPSDEEIDALIAGYKAGTRELPDWRAWIR